MNVSKRARAAGVVATGVALFGGLAAVGLTAGATLSAGPSSPSLPQVLAPPRPAVLSVSAPAPDSTPAALPLTNVGRVTVTIGSGWAAGRHGRTSGPARP